MVKLPVESSSKPSNHRNFGSRFGKRREQMKHKEPATLEDLETLANIAAQKMQPYDQFEYNYRKALTLLRQQYNMEFVVLCSACCGTHDHDNIDAPER